MVVMSIKNFIDTIVEALEERYPQHEVSSREVLKNNGVRLNSVTIKHRDEAVSPNIYVDDYYSAYCAGNTTLSDCVESICQKYERTRRTDVMSVEVDNLMDYKVVRSKIRAKFVNSEANAERLKEIPSVPYLDLSIVFSIVVQEDGNGVATTLVTNEILNEWGVSIEELHRVAMANTEECCGVSYTPMSDIIREQAHLAGVSDEEIDMMLACDILPMTILSTKNHIDGAIALMYAQRSELFEMIGTDSFYVLPSSRHEVILIPKTEDDIVDDLRYMVSSTNCEAVSRIDFLSNSVYRYDAETGTFVIV